MDVGSRIKRVRREKGLTLRALESLSGVSATHLSEIERGHTSPTLGSLARVARALATPPAFFLEQSELGAVSVVGAVNRVRAFAGGTGAAARRGPAAAIEPLTTGIPGGRLQVRRVELPPGSTYRAGPHAHAGVEAIHVECGRVRVMVGERSFDLAPGDVAHFDARLPHGYSNSSRAAAVLIWAATRREVD
jgi:transcriptional regulator with XRE-family HTH domain